MVRTLRIICILAAMATSAILLKFSDLSDGHLIALVLLFTCLVNAPYILGWIAAGRFDGQPAAMASLAVGIVAAFLLGIYGYYDTFFSGRLKDAQDALAFVVLPLYQSAGIITAYLLAKAVSRFR